MANESERTYRVVVNDEEQHSIWPEDKALPPGWHPVAFSGSESACLDHIEVVWRDIRPLSLRRAMAADRAGSEAAQPHPR